MKNASFEEILMKILQLTSLRFFAATGVLMTHYNQHFLNSENHILRFLSSFFSESYVWVCFFFVLSGFIISYSQDGQNRDNAYRYLIKRAARLFPVYIITMLFVWYYFSLAPGYKQTVTSLLLLQSWVPDPRFFWGFNAVAWSISVELFFYVAFLIVKGMSNRQVFIAFALLISFNLTSHLNTFNSRDDLIWFYYINPINRLPDFLAGVLLFRMHKAGRLTVAMKNETIPELSSVIILVTIIILAVSTNIPKSFRYDVLYIAPCTLVIATFIKGSGKISKLLSNRILVSLGESSFCLYMTHQFFIAILFTLIIKPGSIDDLCMFFFLLPIILFACVCLAHAVHHLIEKPAFRLITHRARHQNIDN